MVLSPGQPDPVTAAAPKANPGTPPRPPRSAVAPVTKSPSGKDIESPGNKLATQSGSAATTPPLGSPALSSKSAPAAAVYKAAVPDGADEPEPSEARLVSWIEYARFNLVYIAAMAVIMPVTAVMLSAPFNVAIVVLLFQLGWWPTLLLAPASSCVQLFLTIGWMALLKR